MNGVVAVGAVGIATVGVVVVILVVDNGLLARKGDVVKLSQIVHLYQLDQR